MCKKAGLPKYCCKITIKKNADKAKLPATTCVNHDKFFYANSKEWLIAMYWTGRSAFPISVMNEEEEQETPNLADLEQDDYLQYSFGEN